MVRAVVISPDQELCSKLAGAIERAGRVELVKVAERYMLGLELERLLRANAPQAIFLNIADRAKSMEVMAGIEELVPGMPVVAIDRSCDQAVLLELMRLGVREFLPYPFEGAAFQTALARVEEAIARRPIQFDLSDNVFAFLPSKPGSGTSTVALNAAVALSNLPETRTLLIDMDLNSGLIGFMLQLDNVYTVYEAADKAANLDEQMWPQLVASAGKLDVLPSGRLDPNTRVEPAHLRQLVAFARRFYRAICVDLSGNMEKYSLEVMQESKKIFLVCTPEIPSLHLARQKLQLLSRIELMHRASVILNRTAKNQMISRQQIEKLLGVPVCQEFPNDYYGVHHALTGGREVAAGSELGKQFRLMAERTMEIQPAAKPQPQKKWLDMLPAWASRVGLPAAKQPSTAE